MEDALSNLGTRNLSTMLFTESSLYEAGVEDLSSRQSGRQARNPGYRSVHYCNMLLLLVASLLIG